MIRAICIVGRDYVPSGGLNETGRRLRHLAQSLASAGCAIHVIAAALDGIERDVIDQGVVVHLLAPPVIQARDLRDIEHVSWAGLAATKFQSLDAKITFDAVLGMDHNGETARIRPAPGTTLALLTHGIEFDQPDPFLDPAGNAIYENTAVSLQRSDLIITDNTENAQSLSQKYAAPVVVIDPPRMPFVECQFLNPHHRVELCYLGDLSALYRPDLALRILARLHDRGLDVHLTMIGTDSDLETFEGSYRQTELLPQIRSLAEGHRSVRIIDALSQDELMARLCMTDFLIQCSPRQTSFFDALVALDAGISIIVRRPVHDHEEREHLVGRLKLIEGSDERFVEGAATYIAREISLLETNARARSHKEIANPPANFPAELLRALDGASKELAIPVSARRPFSTNPSLSITIIADKDSLATQRALRSLQEHTDIPHRITLIADEQVDLTQFSDTNSNVTILHVPAETPMSARRNLALDRFDAQDDFIVLFDNHVEVSRQWWSEFLDAFHADPNVGIVCAPAAPESFSTDALPIDRTLSLIANVRCLCFRQVTIARVGRFDERFAPSGADVFDFAIRAARVGEQSVSVSPSSVYFFGDLEIRPSSEDTVRLQRDYAVDYAVPFTVLASLEEAIADTSILAAYKQTFTTTENATLALRRMNNAVTTGDEVENVTASAARAHIDIENGPKVVILLSGATSRDDDAVLARRAHCFLSSVKPSGDFSHLPWIRPESPSDLRVLAARSWRAQDLNRQV